MKKGFRKILCSICAITFVGAVTVNLFYSCHSKINIISNDIKNYQVKVSEDKDKVFQWNDFVDKIELIPLETTDNSLIGDLSSGIITDEDIFIHDFIYKSLLNFDISGKFKRKIGSRGRGPGEYLEIRDFCIGDDGNLYTLDYKKIHCYEKNTGVHIKSWSFDAGVGFNPLNMIIYDEDNYFLWCSNVQDTDKGEHYLMKKMIKGKTKSEYFKYEYQSSANQRFFPCRNDSYYIRPVIDCDNVVYKLTKDSVSASFSIDFGDMAISPKQMVELNSSDPNAFLGSKAFKYISNILEINDYIYFTCIGPHTEIYEGIICQKTGEVNFGKTDYKNCPHFFFSDGTVLYGYYEPDQLIEYKNDDVNLNSCFNEAFNNVEHIKFDDNPILVKVYLK
jgi:hypothetical protein